MFTTMMKRLAQRAQSARLRSSIAQFRSNKRGNVAVITALCALPLIAAIGCVIDYTTASLVKTKLQAAADAAALATVSVNSSVVTTAKGMSSGGTVSGGSTFATNFFNANLNASPANVGYTNLTPTATVTLSGTTMTANGVVHSQGSDLFHGGHGFQQHQHQRFVDRKLHDADLHQFLPDARRLGLDELPFDRRRAGATDGRQSRQPARQPRLSAGLSICLPFQPRRGPVRRPRPRTHIKGRSPHRELRRTQGRADIAKASLFRAWGRRRRPSRPDRQ